MAPKTCPIDHLIRGLRIRGAWLALASLTACTATACTAEPDPSGLPEPLARHQQAVAASATATSPASTSASTAAATATSPSAATATSAAPPAAITTCDQLLAAAAHQPADAAILLELCPDAPTTPALLRHALLMADSPA
ncbi:MAG: hypothetical protein H0T76_24720, partial [Nannocystis sp.]